MLIKPTNYFLGIILFTLLLGCSEDKQVKLVDTNFSGEVQEDQNLKFTFDKAIAPDSLVGLWDSTQYITFTPQIPGVFKWYSPAVLIFSPARRLNPATQYEATLMDEITKISDYKLEKGESIIFNTRLLNVTDISAIWAAGKNNDTKIQINLKFNSPVDGETVARQVKVSLKGKDQKISLLESDGKREVKLLLPDIAVADETFKINVQLNEGLKPVNGNIGMKEPVDRVVMLLSPYSVNVNDITQQHDGIQGTLTVDISQETAADSKDFIEITPAVDFEVETVENGLKITSDEFNAKRRYTVQVKKGLKGKYGGKLKSDFVKDISFGELRPEIAFADNRSVYLSADGLRNMKVRIVNVQNITVSISKLYQNNILSFANQGRYYYDYDNRSVGEKGDLIFEKSYDTDKLPKNGSHRVLSLNFEDEISDYEGIYAIQVRSDEKYWLRDFKLVSISDIGMVAKSGKKNISVFTNSINRAEPLSGVIVSFIGRNNQVVGTATTDAGGVAIFEKPENMPANFEISMIAAQKQKDYNYMRLNETSVNTSQFNVGGRYANLSGFDAFLYGDRDIYRPGETVYLSGILRDDELETPSGVPVKLKIRTPDGKELKTIRKTLNEFGSFETSVQLGAAALTGTYSANLYTANDIFLTSQKIKVEEFMPDRIKVDVNIEKKNIDIDESTAINLKATNFFGPPAANRNYEISITASRKYFYSRDFSDYDFHHVLPNNVSLDRKLYNGKTDANGEVQEEYKLDDRYSDMGLVSANVYSTVFDETGRPVNRKSTITISTQNHYYGIATDRYYSATNSEYRYKLVSLDKSGKVESGVKARVKIVRDEYRTVLSRSGSYYRYRSEKEEKVVEEKIVTLNGKDNEFSFIPDYSGRYHIRISAPDAKAYVERSLYVYGWGGTSNASFEVDSEGKIDIQLDKKSYQPGETANVILKSPFTGKVLVTLETDKLLKHFYVDADKRAVSFPVDISSDFVPNVYLTATLFKPHKETDLPLTVAHGVAPIMVENPENELPLTITAVEKSRSETSQTIKVKTAPNAAVTLAVVDEGILQLTGYKTPDPYRHFYRKTALAVSSHDIYPYLFPEVNITSGRPGGDDALSKELAKRINPLTNKRVKLVAFWSGIMESDGNGEAEFKIDIPQFSGDLRIMATAYDGRAFAAEDENMKVADPMVISTALPRFLSPGDTVMVPVTMTNTTEKPTTGKTQISVSGPLTIIGDRSLSTDIAANAEGRVVYKLLAQNKIGQTNVSVKVNALGESFTNSTDIAIRPASPLQKISGSGTIEGGNSKTINIPSEDFMPKSINRKMVISNSPMVEFAEDLDYLLRYPYGCVEQTVSSVFPQLYYQDLSREVLNFDDVSRVKNSIYFIEQALIKLKGMQLYNGGLTYWPGNGYESWWGSVYAAHFLYEAKKAGYDVDQDHFNKLLDYLTAQLKSRDQVWYYYNNTRRQISRREIAYSLYVLALAGKPQVSTMNYYKSNLNALSLNGKYLLAAAYKLIGDDKKYREVLPSSFSGEIPKRGYAGSIYSYIRDEALALNVLLEVDKDNPQVAVMARHLSQQLKNSRYLNTQERVYSFLALGKIARDNANKKISATVSSGGKDLGTYSNQTATFTSDKSSLEDINIETEGDGKLYYFWEAEGISADGSFRKEDNFLKARKEFYDRNGRRITLRNIRQNDLIVVKLTISSLNGKNVRNVAMTDILPAGFEIENPRVTEVAGTDWIKDASRAQYTDIRDDRISYFFDTGSKQKQFYYVVRAVSKGTFRMGPVGADAMYEGEYHSYSGGGIVEIR